MFDRVRNATLFNSFLWLEGLWIIFPPLVNLGLPLPLISLVSVEWFFLKLDWWSYKILLRFQHKDNKMKSWTDTTSSFPWRRTLGEHWVDKVKNEWKIVGQLPIKAGWWDVSFALQRSSRNIASSPNYKNCQIRPSVSPFFNKKFTIWELASLYFILLSEEPNSDLFG